VWHRPDWAAPSHTSKWGTLVKNDNDLHKRKQKHSGKMLPPCLVQNLRLRLSQVAQWGPRRVVERVVFKVLLRYKVAKINHTLAPVWREGRDANLVKENEFHSLTFVGNIINAACRKMRQHRFLYESFYIFFTKLNKTRRFATHHCHSEKRFTSPSPPYCRLSPNQIVRHTRTFHLLQRKGNWMLRDAGWWEEALRVFVQANWMT
jgi:hypothetical protein